MKNKRSSHSIFAKFLAVTLGLCVATVCGIHSAKAAADTWTGATNGTWGTTTNWSLTTVPLVTDTVTILGPANAAGLLTINIAAAANANLINFTDTSAVTLNNTTSGANQTLTIGAGGITVGTGAVTIGSSTANQGVNIALGASQTWNVGSGGLTVNNVISDGGSAFGITQVGAGTLTLAGANTYTGATTINLGTVTLSGAISSSSALALGGGTLSYTAAGTNTQTFASTAVNGGNSTVTNATATNTVALATITRSGNGLLNISSLTGATTTSNVVDSTGILGTWATEGTGTSLRYAAGGSGGAITAYTAGTAAATAAAVVDTTGAVNYDVAAVGALGAGASFNTLRYTGAAGSITGNFTANGLMDAGTGGLTYTGAVTIGASKELVILSNGNFITLSGVISNNGGGASSITYGGPSANTLALNNANTYSGGTTINGGLVTFNNNTSFGTGAITANGGTIRENGGADLTTTNNLVVNSPTTLDTGAKNWVFNGNISGSGNITRGTNATASMFLGGDDSGYTGTFTIQNNGNSIVRFNTASAGSANARWVDNQGTTGRASLEFGTGSIQFGSLTGTGFLADETGAGIATIQVGNLGLNETFSGVLQQFSPSVMAVTKVGTGAWTLSGASSYTGATTVENGALVAGALVNSGANSPFGNSTAAIALGDATTISSVTALNPQLLTGGAFTIARAITVGASNAALGNAGTTFTIGGNTASASTFSGISTLNQNLSVTQVAGGTLNLTGNITSGATGTQTLTFNNAGTVAQATGVIGGGTGTIALTKSGAGTTTIAGANTYAGATNITGGTLTLTGAGAINGSSGITINGSGAKFLQIGTVASTPAITLTQGTLDGTGTVGAVTVGAGTGGILTNGNGTTSVFTLGSLTFSGAGTASLRMAGGATTNSPVLAVTGALTLSGGAGSVTVNLTPTSALINGNTYQLISYGGAFTGTASTDFSLAPGLLSGRQSSAFASTAASNGFITLTVSGDNPVWSGASSSVLVEYPLNTALTTGNLALKTGHTATDFWTNDSLEFNDTYNVGAGDVAVTQTTVDIQGGATNAGGIAANTLTFNNSAVNYTIMSSVGKGITAGSVIKNGTGAVTISTSNSYSGATTLNSGGLNINNASAIGTGALVIVSGTIDNTSGSAVTLTTNNAQNWNGDFSFGGSNNLSLGTGAVTLGASRTVTTNGSGSLTIGGVIAGSGFGLTKSGTGTLVLNGANTFNGGFAINGGTVRAGNNAALGASTNALTFGAASNGRLQVNGNSITLPSLNGDSTITIENSNATNGTLIDSNTSSDAFAGTIQDGSAGTLALVKNGANTLALSGNNSYSGGTTISAGTLSVGSNTALGTGSVAFNGGTLVNSTNVSLGNAISTASATGIITSSGGGMVLNGNITGANGLTLNPTNKITLAGTNLFATPASGSFIGLNINAGAGGVDITGSTTVGDGGSTNQNGNFAIAGTTTVTIQSGGSFTINGSTNTVPNTIIGQNAAGTSTLLVNGGSLIVGANTGLIIGNANGSAVGVLTISSGTATITAGSTTATDNRSFIALGRDNNSATGTINLNGGTLATGRNFVRDGSSAAGSGIANFVFGGGTLQALANQTDWLNSATINGNQLALSSVTTTAVSTIDPNGFSVAINSAISGAGGFNINSSTGTGTVTFGGANSYTGATTVTGGTLSLTGALAATAITVNGGTFSEGSSGLLNSTGASVAVVSGTASLAGSNGYNGATTVSSAGTLNLTGMLTGATAIAVNGGVFSESSAGVISGAGASLAVTGGTASLVGSNGYNGATTVSSAGTLNLTGMLTGATAIAVNGGVFSESSAGVISGAGASLAVTGGTASLVGSNGYSGATTVSGAGTLNLTGMLTGDTAIAVNGGVLSESGAGVIGGAGASLAVTGGTATLAGANTYGGSTNVNGGTLIVSGGLSGNGAVTANSGGTLGGGGSISGAVNIGQGGTLAPGFGLSNGGTEMTLNNNLTLSGTADISLNIDQTNGTDILLVAGNLQLDPSNTDTLTLNLLGGFTPSSSPYVFASYGAESGQFGNVVVNGGAYTAVVNYNYLGGDDIAVTLVAVPEPASWATMLAGFALLLTVQQLRRRRL